MTQNNQSYLMIFRLYGQRVVPNLLDLRQAPKSFLHLGKPFNINWFNSYFELPLASEFTIKTPFLIGLGTCWGDPCSWFKLWLILEVEQKLKTCSFQFAQFFGFKFRSCWKYYNKLGWWLVFIFTYWSNKDLLDHITRWNIFFGGIHCVIP